MRGRGIVVAGLLLSAGVPALAAQAPTPVGGVCLDELPASALRRAVARLTIRADSTRDTAVAFAVGFLAEDLGTALRARLGGSDSTLAPADSLLSWRDLARASVGLVIGPNGFVWRADASTPPGVVRMLAPVLDSLTAAPPALAWPDGTTERVARATLSFTVPPFDSTGRPLPDAVGLGAASYGPPVFTIAHPWHVPAMARAGALRGIRYPDFARNRGIAGRLLLEFVVGPDGRAEPGSIRDLQRPTFAPGDADLAEGYERFRQAVVAAVERESYIAAVVGGCPVRRLVQQTFEFGIR